VQVVEEQITEELVTGKLQPYLLPDESETLAELQQKLADMLDELLFHLPFPPAVGRAEEVEQVRIPRRLLREIGPLVLDRRRKVGDRLSIWRASTSRLQPCSSPAEAYQSLRALSSSF
jgi:hypothetical protein